MVAPSRRPGAAASVVACGMLSLALSLVLSGCVAEPGEPTTRGPALPTTGTTGTSGATPGATADAASPAASPTPTAAAARIPTDCTSMISEGVRAQFGSIPLNDPAMGPSGVQSDGSLVCIWRDPGADTTGLTTTVSYVSRGPALDLLNDLANTQGFTCYTPNKGTRCEKTWANPTYPVTDGRTLFWRDGILIDTSFSNLAPSGYTDSVVTHIFG